MTDSFIFLTILAALCTFYIGVSYFISKSIHSKKDFFLGGRSFGVFPIAATLLATQVGGGMFLGTAQEPIKGLLYIIGLAIGFLVLGFGIAEKYRNCGAETISEVLGQKYNSALLSNICGFISLASIIGILLGQAVAARSVLLYFGGENTWYVFPLFWLSMVAYTFIGGLSAVIFTDMIQIAIVILVFTGIFLHLIFNAPEILLSPEGFGSITNLFAHTKLTSADVSRLVMIPILFSIITQDLAHRFFAAKNGLTAKLSATYAGVALLFFGFIPFFFGLRAKLEPIIIQKGVSPLLPYLQAHTSAFFFILAACGLIAAIGSTIDGLLCAGSSVVANLYTRISNHADNKVSLSQKIVFIFGTLILIASYFMPASIIDLLVNSYEISVACLIVPVLFALFTTKKHLNWHSGLFAMIFGFSGLMVSKIGTYLFLETWGFLLALILSVLGHFIGDFLYTRTDA
ncbi:hypothetical protein EBU24_05610 [bacterium]|nr:hypothetical protein [bacterium]